LSFTHLRWFVAAAAAMAALVAAGCGDNGTEPTKVSMSISEQGKKATFTAPKSVKGGLVELHFKNNGKAPHGVQFIQYTGNHTADDVRTQLNKNSNKVPAWLRAEGGTPPIAGGQTDSATLNLPGGNYLVVDSASLGPSSGGPPANTELKVSAGDTGDLPDTPGTVTAAETGKDKFAWEISGLKSGRNDITFNSKGDDALHLIIAAPVKGKAPSVGQIKKDLGSQSGPPPPYLDFQNSQSTAVLDGGLSQTTSLELKKPGQYIFFCPLTDRDGGKTHDQEGLLKVVTVK
jgi:hypothetical protein